MEVVPFSEGPLSEVPSVLSVGSLCSRPNIFLDKIAHIVEPSLVLSLIPAHSKNYSEY